MHKPKIITAKEAADIIQNGSVLVNTGMMLAGNCEAILRAMEESFLSSGKPNGLTLIHSASQADRVAGIEHLAHPGMTDRIIGAHWGLAPRWMNMIAENRICAYNIPQGQLVHMLHSIACHEFGPVTKVGLDTFIDPRLEGGKMNDLAREREDLNELLVLGGEEWIHYKQVLPDVALIRGTSMDEDGNLSTEEEGLKLELLTAALAVKRSRGIVIAQVKRLVKNGDIHPQRVAVPGIHIDYAVVCEDPQKEHRQCSSIYYSPAVCGDSKEFLTQEKTDGTPDVRTLIGRRALLEASENELINLGIGIPNDSIGQILSSERMGGFVTPTVESGICGGVALGDVDFGVGKNCTAIIPHEQQFDFYDGRGVDTCFMGVGEIDLRGNVNATKMGRHIPGCGGFIDITQNARKVVFCTTFTASGLRCLVEPEGVVILQEGKIRKFVRGLQQVSFSAKRALQSGQKVVYVTERAVFELTDQGLLLTEKAPGMDISRDIIGHMEFVPRISPHLREMDPKLFGPSPFGLAELIRGTRQI
ncbi:MAG: acyl CoA:acetate/3-ketoacid CoA transferase [Lachnospiraceae bacterium]|nr:acyl CoA:acetate/3-ketoacid CoA transferase [Lachnospiraceae bacterium]